MAVRIKNLRISGPILVPLTTGTTLRLSPGQVSDEVADVEVANNATVDKLQRQGVIRVERTEETPNPSPDAAAEAAPAKSRRRPSSSE